MEKTPTPDVLIEQNRKLKNFLTITIITLILSLSFIVLIVIVNLIPTTEDVDTQEDTQIENSTENDSSDVLLVKDTDLSEYTDIVLKNNEDVAFWIFDGFAELEEVTPGSYPSGIVNYYIINSNDIGYMRVFNSKSIKNAYQQNLFDQTKEDIETRNLEAEDLDGGHLTVFTQELSGSYHEVVKEIKGIEYPNTDNTFAVLFIGGYQAHIHADPDDINKNEGFRFKVAVFAIKDDNLIYLYRSYEDSEAILGLQIEDQMQCIDNYTQNEETYYYFSLECLSNLLRDTKYDAKIKELTMNMIERFEFAETD